MTKQEKIIWGLLAAVLIILFLLSSTDLIIKEKKTEIYPVSVIVGDTTDDYYVNFHKGVDKAADEYNVDVNFITLYEKGDVKEQMELLEREIGDGTKAVVLDPIKPLECAAALNGMTLNSPLIIMGNLFSHDKVRGGISEDYGESGRMLGEAIVSGNQAEVPVFVFTEGLDYGYNREAYNSLFRVLTEAGFRTFLYEKDKESSGNSASYQNEDLFRKAIEETVSLGSGKAVIAALDVQSLDSAADIVKESQGYSKYISGLYGIGSTTKVLNRMDQGIVKGLVVSNQFDAGYLSIVKAVEAIEKSRKREQIVLESYYIEKEDLQESRFEKILYPIE
ncbi:substrate-binding domain-containing protein [Clostridium sp. MCC353]|uniref:substrate-binding domain-containing protein n=1 Tax=Clostridium sp. MCC353 TaxID=2592646 RepID=UPI001C01982D|nr:substrate-binding domain-containing protein [Clostridium sp. MCC353]MBT9779271.1 substrate-binding domain-containing protein [Clostridium sp. MCC353]